MSGTPEAGAGERGKWGDYYFDRWDRLGNRVERLEKELAAERERVREMEEALQTIVGVCERSQWTQIASYSPSFVANIYNIARNGLDAASVAKEEDK